MKLRELLGKILENLSKVEKSITLINFDWSISRLTWLGHAHLMLSISPRLLNNNVFQKDDELVNKNIRAMTIHIFRYLIQKELHKKKNKPEIPPHRLYIHVYLSNASCPLHCYTVCMDSFDHANIFIFKQKQPFSYFCLEILYG